MLPRRHGLLVVLLGGAFLQCPPDNKDLLYEPVPVEAHEVKILADAQGDAKAPAHVAVFLKRGILQMKGGAVHTLEGVATGAVGDAPPRLELMQDRIALTQSTLGGNAPRGDAKFMLALGATPMALEIDTGTGEAQTIDLGGVPVAKARFHTVTGHLTIDWSAPNPQLGAELTFETQGGYIDVSHLARSGARAIDVVNVAGLVNLDVGTLAGVPSAFGALSVTATVTSGTFVFKVPANVAALATVQAPEGSRVFKGWKPGAASDTFVTGAPDASPRITLRVAAQAGKVELRTD
jgi:hypothetical protein